MAVSLYAVSVPVFSRMLRNLHAILELAESFATERGFSVENLFDARLAPDMIPFRGQVQIATDHAKGAASRLSGLDVPSWPDDEANFAQLKARLQKAIDYLATFNEGQFDGAETRSITLKTRAGEATMTGLEYLNERAMPNFYFHVTTAYDILRKNGVPLGKRYFIG